MGEQQNTSGAAVAPAVLDFIASVSGGSAANVLPVSAAIAAKARREEEERQAAIRNATPGEFIEGEGIYLGRFHLQGLSTAFNIFAAPEDLTDRAGEPLLLKYAEASDYLHGLGNWHDHDCRGYWNDSALYASLSTGSYEGEWVIPPRELLDGKNEDGEIIQPDNFLTHKNTGAFKKAFTAKGRHNADDMWYMSSKNLFGSGKVYYGINLISEPSGGVRMTASSMRCRPVRLVPVGKGGPHG